MANKRSKSEGIVSKSRPVEVLIWQDLSLLDGIRRISAVDCTAYKDAKDLYGDGMPDILDGI